jgi:hypothetical protein
MSSNPEYSPQPEGSNPIDSPEYREKVMRKLNCLIAVLDVACTKVRRSLAGPEPDVERLTRIQDNLTKTLKVCRKAKLAIERREALPDDLPASLSNVVGDIGMPKPRTKAIPTGAYIEMSSNAEARRFKGLGPISSSELRTVDLDDLAAQLQGE